MRKQLFDVAATPTIVGRVVNATITLICVLIVYDGWANLRFRDALWIVVGPVFAIFTSHVFASSLVKHIELGRRPTRTEWIAIVRFESRMLLLAVPPVAILVILDLAGVSLSESIRVIIWLEGLSLTFWAGVAAHRAGLRGRSFALAVFAGLIITAIVLGLQVAIQPGKAVDNGVAAGRFTLFR
jgi:hypothetical protein